MDRNKQCAVYHTRFVRNFDFEMMSRQDTRTGNTNNNALSQLWQLQDS